MTAIFSLPLRLYRHVIVDSIRIVKKDGFRELIRQRGWRFVVGVVAYYLVRDSLLYIVIPLYMARRLS